MPITTGGGGGGGGIKSMGDRGGSRLFVKGGGGGGGRVELACMSILHFLANCESQSALVINPQRASREGYSSRFACVCVSLCVCHTHWL